MMALDSHIHIWDRTRGETFIAERQFPQLTGKAFLPEEVPAMLAATRAEKAVLVHGPSSLAHTAHCLEMANANSMFLSVIGWINIRGGNWRAELDGFSIDPLFKGVRLMPVLDEEPEALLRSDETIAAARRLGEAGQILEILAWPELFPAVEAIARAAPDTTISLAHFGLPNGSSDRLPAWRSELATIASCANTIIKVSGLPLTGKRTADAKMARDHFKVLLDQFGAHRMCYASNWPVATALAPPAYWRDLLDEVMTEAGLSTESQKLILYETADKLYCAS